MRQPIWVSFINTNQNKKNPDEEITSKDIADICTQLQYTLSNNSIKLETFNDYFEFMKSNQAETTHAPNTAHHQTTTTYHQPYARENDPYKQPVKPMGQNADKHSHCEIL